MKNLYRAVALSLAVLSLVGISPSRATEGVLYRFTGGSDGRHPWSDLVADAKGALYGTTNAGGSEGYGVVFKLTPPAERGAPWIESVLYSFCQQFSCIDGSYPEAGLIFDKQGTLYGTTSEGGYGPDSIGYGTVFKLEPNPGHAFWREIQLYSFCGVGYFCSDGNTPTGRLIFGTDGALYGTTLEGGSTGGSALTCLDLFLRGCGTAFKLTPPARPGVPWTETVIYNFCSLDLCNDGGYSSGGLIFGKAGALYGTASEGGEVGYGAVFKLTPRLGHTTWTETVLHSFGYCPGLSDPACQDGAGPSGRLIADANGVLYGTTFETVNFYPPGTVFMLTPPPAHTSIPWIETILHGFTGGSDGEMPVAGLIAYQGALYGTTQYGGNGGCTGETGCGTVFEITGNGFVPPTSPVVFPGTPGTADCIGSSVSTLAHTYGGITHAAASVGYASVTDLQNAIVTYCRG
jgi:uncharacterized repeat protein (TIGR03803 family)